MKKWINEKWDRIINNVGFFNIEYRYKMKDNLNKFNSEGKQEQTNGKWDKNCQNRQFLINCLEHIKYKICTNLQREMQMNGTLNKKMFNLFTIFFQY